MNVHIERHVTFGEYMRLAYVADVLGAPQNSGAWAFPDDSSAEANTSGTVVDFTFQEQGLRKKPIGLRWVIFAAGSGRPLAQSDEQSDPWCHYQADRGASPCLTFGGELKDLDVTSFAFWVRTDDLLSLRGEPVKCLVARIEAYEEASRLSYADSAPFARTPRSPKTCAGVGKE